MFISYLKLFDFKNHVGLELDFRDKINLIIGNNGSGKTNILDAINYLSTTKSYFNSSDIPAVHYGSKMFFIEGTFSKKKLIYKVQCQYNLKEKKEFKVNESIYKVNKEHIGLLPLIFVSPDDMDCIKAGSEFRRKLFDSILCQINSTYLDDLILYNRFLSQRNAFIKKYDRIERVDKSLLSTYDVHITKLGKAISKIREEFINKFMPIFTRYYAEISKRSGTSSNSNDYLEKTRFDSPPHSISEEEYTSSTENVSIVYRSHFSSSDYEDEYYSALEKDILLGYTTRGIHRDDYIFKIENLLLKSSGSQGQKKTFLLAIKFAFRDIAKDMMELTPIILLDDVFDKLDDSRIANIAGIISREGFGQVFITDARRERSRKIFEGIDVHVISLSNQ